MTDPVVVIGLDAAEPSLVERGMASGALPVLAGLRAQGAYGRLEHFDHYRAETPWTTFLTGVAPARTGYWTPLRLREGTYDVVDVAAYDFAEYPPFYRLGDRRRVAVFDVPQARIVDDVNGVQVLGWGAHSPQTPSRSAPAGLLDELTRRHGAHPTLLQDEAPVGDARGLARLAAGLAAGIDRRAAVCRDLLAREPWDLFVTVFGETHSVQHYLWHLHDPEHPLHPPRPARDPVLDVFQRVDRAIGEILAGAPARRRVVVFATHGMEANSMDLPSMLFLPELLYRLSFPGRRGIHATDAGTPLPPPRALLDPRPWVQGVWRHRHDPSRVRAWVRRRVPRLLSRLDRLMPPGVGPVSYAACPVLGYQPAMWYRPLWPAMRAFALPSYSEGYVRLNLAGREPAGLVAPAEYGRVCDELTAHLHQLTDARSGKPLVRRVIRTRSGRDARDGGRGPDADLVVTWESLATDTVESPAAGRLGPFPFSRTGSHRHEGFLLASGPGISAGRRLPRGHTLDLAPTILDLVGAPRAVHHEGRPLLARAATASA